MSDFAVFGLVPTILMTSCQECYVDPNSYNTSAAVTVGRPLSMEWCLLSGFHFFVMQFGSVCVVSVIIECECENADVAASEWIISCLFVYFQFRVLTTRLRWRMTSPVQSRTVVQSLIFVCFIPLLSALPTRQLASSLHIAWSIKESHLIDLKS